MSYDESIPAPHRILGFELGSRQVTPEEQVAYIRHLAALSPRVELGNPGSEPRGTATASGRDLVPGEPLTARGNPEEHLERAANGGLESGVAGDSPVVVWLAYSIHGNESSGANASLLSPTTWPPERAGIWSGCCRTCDPSRPLPES